MKKILSILPFLILSISIGLGQTTTVTINGRLIKNVSTVNINVDTVVPPPIHVIPKYTVSVVNGGNGVVDTGSVAVGSSVVIDSGRTLRFGITPNTNYHTSSVLLDGISQGVITGWTVPNISSNHILAVVFGINTFSITATQPTGATISPSGTTVLNAGDGQTYTISATTGYNLDSLVVDGVKRAGSASYTFSNVTANHTITATTKVSSFTITSSAGTGGTISPNGATSVNNGSNIGYTITPSAGYYLTSLVVDGVISDSTTHYTFKTVLANHTIVANFAIYTYTVTSSSSSGGSITPTGVSTVNYGASLSYVVAPSTGYKTDSVKVDGARVDSLLYYTFTNITADHTIAGYFSLSTYTLVASSDSNGTISPSGTMVVNYGASQTYTFTPNIGYITNTIIVDGVSQAIATSYTFSNISAGHTISVSFIKQVIAVGQKIMPFGNSITATTCYPPYVWEDLQAGGYTNVSYVGTVITNAGQGVTCSGKAYYQSLEGHSGYTAAQLASGLSGWLTTLGTNMPDIVYMHVGTNDYWNGGTASDVHSTILSYTSIVNTLRSFNPNVKIAVAQLIPSGYSTAMNSAITLLNDSIPAWASRTATSQSPIAVVDLNTGFNTSTYYSDSPTNVHPNSAGAKWMADKMYTQLVSFLGSLPTPDTTAPTVSITHPTTGSQLSGVDSVTATATDNVGVVGVLFQLDGSNIGVEQTVPVGTTYKASLNTNGYSNGSHAITATARDAAGNKSVSTTTITISNVSLQQGIVAYDPFTRADANPLTGYRWNTLSGQTSGSTMRLVSNAIQAYSVSNTTGDFGGIVWDSLCTKGSGVSLTLSQTSNNSVYTSLFIYAKMAGKTLTSGNGYRFRYVYPSAFSIEKVTGGTNGTAIVSTTHSISIGDTMKFFIANDAYGTMSAYINSTQILSTADTTYHPTNFYYWVRSGVNATASRYDNWMVYNTISTVVPATPILTFPINKDTGVVKNPTFAWTESVAGSTFRLQVSTSNAFGTTVIDDSTVGATSYPSPNLTLNTRYFWRVRAKNPVGYSAYSVIDTFTITAIAPDTIAPVVAITNPINHGVDSNTVTVSATATDNVKVVGVTFKDNGTIIGSEDLTSPYSVSWNTKLVQNGAHSITATARDSAGNTKTATVVDTIRNSVVTSSMWISAYYPGWEQSTLPASSIDYHAMTAVIYFAAYWNTDGTINTSGNGVTYNSNVQTMITNAHAAGTKVLFAFGGSSPTSETIFMTVTATAALQATTIHNMMVLIRQAGYDGIDLDIEPLSSGDQAQVLSFSKALRDSLTAYNASSVMYFTTQWAASVSAAIYQYYDQINIQTYNLAGLWSGWLSWHNGSIYKDITIGSQPICADDYINEWYAAGVPLNKLGAGVAFEGVVYSGITAPRQSISGGAVVHAFYAYSSMYANYIQPHPEYAYWDTAAQASWSYVPSPAGWATYDNEQMCAAYVQYVKDKKIGGLILWEIGEDVIGTQQPLLQAIKSAYGGH